MALNVPEGKKLDRLELFMNETRLATLFGPPWVQTVDIPKNEGVGYLRAVATLKDDLNAQLCYLLSFLFANNLEDPPWFPPADDPRAPHQVEHGPRPRALAVRNQEGPEPLVRLKDLAATSRAEAERLRA